MKQFGAPTLSFSHRRVHVTGVNEDATEVTVRDGMGWGTTINGTIRPKGMALPETDEIWIIERLGNEWMLRAQIRASQGDLGPEINALVAAKIAEELAAAALIEAERRAQEAALAAGIFGGSATVLIQPTQPGTEHQNDDTLWIDTSFGQARPFRWSALDNQWVLVVDQVAMEAALAAVAAHNAAQDAQQTAADAAAAAEAAQDAANLALEELDILLLDLVDIQLELVGVVGQLDGKSTIWPVGSNPTLGVQDQGDMRLLADGGVEVWTGTQWVDADPRVAEVVQDAAEALGLAGTKSTTYYKATPPVADDISPPETAFHTNDFWLRISDNRLHRWDGAQWQEVQDASIPAIEAELAQQLLDLIDLKDDLVTVEGRLDGKSTVYVQDTPPDDVSGPEDTGDIWIDTSDGGRVYKVWDGTQWVITSDPRIEEILGDLDTKITTYYLNVAPMPPAYELSTGDLWVRSDDNRLHRWSGSEWVEIQDEAIAEIEAELAQQLLDLIDVKQDLLGLEGLIDGKSTVYVQETQPTEVTGPEHTGDIWIDTSGGERVYKVWDGAAWQEVTDPRIEDILSDIESKITTFYLADPPAPPAQIPVTGDLWVRSSDNRLHRWNGSEWVEIQDQSIGEIEAELAQQLLDLVDVKEDLAGLEGLIDGKSTVYVQDTQPTEVTGSEHKGDIWIDTSGDGRVYKVWDGSAWQEVTDPRIEDILSDIEGKITTYYQDSAPPAEGLVTGDLWVRSTDGKLHRWDGSTWVPIALPTEDEVEGIVKDAINIIDNPTITGELGRWTRTGGAGLLDMASRNMGNETLPVMLLSGASNMIAWSSASDAPVKIDPTKAYRVSVWLEDSAVVGGLQLYFGVQFYRAPSISPLQVIGVARQSGSTIGPNAWVYFQSYATNAPVGGFVEVVGYLMPYDTDPADMVGLGQNNTHNMVMPLQANSMRVMILNYGNADHDVWIGHPTVTEVDPQSIVRARDGERKIDAVLITANGKNRVTYTTIGEEDPIPTLPPEAGQTSGDIHRARRPNGLIVAEWSWTGSAWVTIDFGDEILRSMDVGKLTAGTGVLDVGVVNKLWTDVVRSRKITTDMLLVTGDTDNLLENPGLQLQPEGGPTGWMPAPHISIEPFAFGPVGDASLQVNGAGSGAAKSTINTNLVPFRLGDELYVKAMVRMGTGRTASGNVGICWSTTDADGVIQQSGVLVQQAPPGLNAMAVLEGVWSGTAFTQGTRVSFGPWVAGAQNGIVDYYDFEVRSRAGSVLIKDGAIIAEKIATGMLNADITVSGTIQTATAGERVVINSAGLYHYPAAGADPDFSADSSGISIVGRISTSSATGQGISIIPDGDFGRGSIRFDNEALVAPAEIRLAATGGNSSLIFRGPRSGASGVGATLSMEWTTANTRRITLEATEARIYTGGSDGFTMENEAAFGTGPATVYFRNNAFDTATRTNPNYTFAGQRFAFTGKSMPKSGTTMFNTQFLGMVLNGPVEITGALQVQGRDVDAGPWRTFTPTITSAGTNPTYGNTTRVGRWCRIGNTVHFTINFTIGSTFNKQTGNWSFNLPVNPFGTVKQTNIGVNITCASGQMIGVGVIEGNTNNITRVYVQDGATLRALSGQSAVFDWSTGHRIEISGTYECAG